MNRLTTLNPANAAGKTKTLFDAVEKKLGIVPNMMRTMGNSAALLEGCLNFGAALEKGRLGAKVAELIAVVVAESNGCDYCLAAHTYIGKNLLKIDAGTLSEARRGSGSDARTDAILKFSKKLVNKRGQVSDVDFGDLKAAGVSEEEIAEVIGQVALNILTNYFNIAVNTELEFPKVESITVEVVEG